MKDGYGREIDYLRISLTDKCNLRCGYCMPPDGIKHLSHADILSFEELGRIVRIMNRLGIKRVRLTGGEPLVRRGILEFIKILKKECDLLEITMTSNGMLLAETPSGPEAGDIASLLREAGLSGINISLDTLDPMIFRKLSGADGLDRVLRGIDAAISAGLEVKLNCVPVRGMNDTEVTDLVCFARERGITIRFIELMPIGCALGYEGVPADEVREQIGQAFGTASELMDDDDMIRKGPAVYYSFEKYKGRIGFISPLSRSFCESCNRVRLTSAGYLKLCLQYPDGVDLKTPMRQGASDGEIEEIIKTAIKKKPAAHSFGAGQPGSDRRKMVEIGG